MSNITQRPEEIARELRRAGRAVTAIEVKSGRSRGARSGLTAFAQAYRRTRTLLVSADGIALEEFLTRPVEHWLT